jgi:hypothetical protein
MEMPRHGACMGMGTWLSRHVKRHRRRLDQSVNMESGLDRFFIATHVRQTVLSPFIG